MEKVGDLEIQYKTGTSATVINRVINAELHKLLINGGQITVSRS